MFQLANHLTVLAAGSDFSGIKINFNLDFVAIAAYVLLALGLYAIAKRRGISKPWLAWIPFGQTWILGSISDQYRYVSRGEHKSKRKVMLALEIIMCVLIVVVVVVLFSVFIGIFSQLDFDTLMQNPQAAASMMEELLEYNLEQLVGSLGIMLLVLLPTLGVALALAILQYMAYHDLFASCDPKNKTLFTTLGIILDVVGLSVVLSVFVLICKNKDEGMPPRVEDQPVVEPVYVPMNEQQVFDSQTQQ